MAMVIAVEARELSGGGLNLDPLLALSALCTEHRPGLGYKYRGMCTVIQQSNS